MTQTIPPTRKTRGWYVIKWIETFCVHTAGEFIGKPFRLLHWQKLLILAVFAIDPETSLRLYRWALIGVAKKNGKTELAAALALFFLIGDGEPAALVICAAASDEQADLVFGAARRMCELSPFLRDVTEGGRFESEILVTDPDMPGCKLVRVAAAAGTNDGKNPHAIIIDEFHEWQGKKGRDVWTVLTNGTGARRQPFVLQITTAGHDMEGTVCGEQYSYGLRVASGDVRDEGSRHFFFYWHAAPDGADHRDPRVWQLANPSWGHTLPKPQVFFADQLSKKTEAEFRRYFLNQWTEAEEIWEVAQLWAGLKSGVRLDAALPVCVGIDLGLYHDSSAIVVAQYQPQLRKPRVVLRAYIWSNPYRPRTRQHSTWKLNIQEVRARIVELANEFPEWAREEGPGPAFFYDPKFMEMLADELVGEGINMLAYDQTDTRMIAASVRFYQLAKDGILTHNGDAAFARQIRNVHAEVKRGGWRIAKLSRGSTRHVDAAIAASIAAFEATRGDSENDPVEISFY